MRTNIHLLSEHIKGQVGLLFTSLSPEEVRRGQGVYIYFWGEFSTAVLMGRGPAGVRRLQGHDHVIS